jgi:hypothetical protein
MKLPKHKPWISKDGTITLKLLCEPQDEPDGTPGYGNGCSVRGCITNEGEQFFKGHEFCYEHYADLVAGIIHLPKE